MFLFQHALNVVDSTKVANNESDDSGTKHNQDEAATPNGELGLQSQLVEIDGSVTKEHKF